MSGQPGRSGGARPGAGRPRKTDAEAVEQGENEAPQVSEAGEDDGGQFQTSGELEPIEFLLAVMNDNSVDPKLRVRAAVAAAQYRHTKRGDAGKKEERQNAAKAAGAGKYAPGVAPKLVVNNR